jgi:hypothetical protein
MSAENREPRVENCQFNDRPILFSGEMVRAILEGRKTQTRRVIKKTVDFTSQDKLPKNWIWAKHMLPDEDAEFIGVPVCPYGIPGDRLWVRETWQVEYRGDSTDGSTAYVVTYKADKSKNWLRVDEKEYWKYHKLFDKNSVWHPSIFLPRLASRILLEVVSIRVEMVQDISLTDINAEGTPFTLHRDKRPYGSRREHFQRLWDSINSNHQWFRNPWVWVIEFKRIDR